LHDAAHVADSGVPTVMLFVRSKRGLSHTREEDTDEADLALALQALDRLAGRVLDGTVPLGG
jgi:N-carbamoyl-L-amino-acid hydrolase